MYLYPLQVTQNPAVYDTIELSQGIELSTGGLQGFLSPAGYGNLPIFDQQFYSFCLAKPFSRKLSLTGVEGQNYPPIVGPETAYRKWHMIREIKVYVVPSRYWVQQETLPNNGKANPYASIEIGLALTQPTAERAISAGLDTDRPPIFQPPDWNKIRDLPISWIIQKYFPAWANAVPQPPTSFPDYNVAVNATRGGDAPLYTPDQTLVPQDQRGLPLIYADAGDPDDRTPGLPTGYGWQYVGGSRGEIILPPNGEIVCFMGGLGMYDSVSTTGDAFIWNSTAFRIELAVLSADTYPDLLSARVQVSGVEPESPGVAPDLSVFTTGRTDIDLPMGLEFGTREG